MTSWFVRLIAVLVFLAVGAWLIARANAQEVAGATLSDCVVKTAEAQGYTGNPHSQEAWQLFAGDCN